MEQIGEKTKMFRAKALSGLTPQETVCVFAQYPGGADFTGFQADVN